MLGLCCVLDAPAELRPACLGEMAGRIIPSLVLLFQGLQRAYAQKAALENEDDDDAPGDDDEDAYEPGM